MTFLIANTLATTLFIYIAMKELFDDLILEALDHGLIKDENIQIARKIEVEILSCIENLTETPLDELYSLLEDIPDPQLKQKILEGIDEQQLKTLIPLLAKQNLDSIQINS